MKINNIQQSSSFGLLYTQFLSKEHEKLIRPIFPKLANLGKKADIVLTSKSIVAEQGNDYKILVDGIQVVTENREKFNNPVRKDISVGMIKNEAESFLNTLRNKILNEVTETVNKIYKS